MPFDLDHPWRRQIEDWFGLAWRVLDDVLASLPADTEVTTIQLWPEHFDAATTVTVAAGATRQSRFLARGRLRE